VDFLRCYKSKDKHHPLPPHPCSVAEKAVRNGSDGVIIPLGESGSGKSSNVQMILHYLTLRCHAQEQWSKDEILAVSWRKLRFRNVIIIGGFQSAFQGSSRAFQGRAFQGRAFQGRAFQGRAFQGRAFQGSWRWSTSEMSTLIAARKSLNSIHFSTKYKTATYNKQNQHYFLTLITAGWPPCKEVVRWLVRSTELW
jgi:hypothetical protein